MYIEKSDSLSLDLRKFFLACEIFSSVMHDDCIVYKVASAYIESSVDRSNEKIKILGLNLVARKTASNTFVVEERKDV